MDRTIQPEIQPLKNFHIQTPVRTTLPNGIPLTVINAGEQEVVRMDVLFSGGRWQQSQKLQALFTNRMLREGTTKYTAATIAEKLDYYGSWLELSSSSEYAYITVYSLNKYLAKTLEVVESMIKEPLFPQKELQTILDTNIQQYLVNTSKVDFLAHRSLLKSLYGEQHPCGKIVMEEDYHTITPEVLREFYERHYHSGNCSIFLSGKVTDDIISRVTDIFGIPFGQYQLQMPKSSFPFAAIPEKRIFTEREDAMQSAVKMGCTTITREHPDYPKLRVLMTLFGGYFGSRLMSNIREDKGYTYGISAGVVFYPDSGLLIVSTETDNEYVEPLIQEVYHEIDRLHLDPVSAEELRIVRNYMLGEMCRSYESPFSLSDAWIFIATSGLKDDYFARSLQAVNEITPAEIQDLAQRYLCKETLKEVIAGKKLS
ncbi:M16 family metallopeptidase [Bacteroides finegoldii]|jgi:zinc protease|uniref:Insulinase family protein n=1 Tax=Bacteroides finegoldii TaxID=338188 RepID=A0A174C9Y3_9BACE|nr:pitrilysin family protein [Bacteroides finegoldii]KAA5216324.1 insulinase family protein [Bacteroides finegoldii]KAA5220592.1 insulinase family protein [Bacteroides finegoldii]KAA5225167.1 insulinase family protein [Bacteroides finegoldii]KAA5229876.1 insulinase family protein [Bacteroides finegoldii]KAA5234227.1 insulinase family protein [Bacteroides finegoldii]